MYPGGNAYCATKFAVDALTRSLRLDLFGTPIRVRTVDPGRVETEFSVVRFRADDVADIILYVATRPAHVNVDQVIVKPTAEARARMVARG